MSISRIVTVFGITACVALVGCGNKHVTQKEITGDLTPELRGTSLRPAEAHNAFALTSNQNLRMLSDDLGELFYTNTPSRLSPYPIVNNTGLAW